MSEIDGPAPSAVFGFCPRCGEPKAPAAPLSPFTCAKCGFVFYFSAALAAVAIVTDPGGRVLLIRRSRDPGRGRLAMPGGFVDVGERAEDALRRELREEVCLEIDDPAYLTSEPNSYLDLGIRYPVLDLFFTARADSPSRASAGDDVDGVVWEDPERLDPTVLAFISMQRAFRTFLARQGPGKPGPSGAGP